METKVSKSDENGVYIEEMTPEENLQWEAVKEFTLVADDRDASAASTIPIPYFFTVYAVTVTGVLYLKERLEDSYTDGVWAGVIIGRFHLDRTHPEATGSNGIVKLTIRADISGRTLYWRACTRDWLGRWRCTGWNKIIHF